METRKKPLKSNRNSEVYPRSSTQEKCYEFSSPLCRKTFLSEENIKIFFSILFAQDEEILLMSSTYSA